MPSINQPPTCPLHGVMRLVDVNTRRALWTCDTCGMVDELGRVVVKRTSHKSEPSTRAHLLMKATGLTLQSEYPHGSLQHHLGYHMALLAIALDAATRRDDWDDTVSLHARHLARAGAIFLAAS